MTIQDAQAEPNPAQVRSSATATQLADHVDYLVGVLAHGGAQHNPDLLDLARTAEEVARRAVAAEAGRAALLKMHNVRPYHHESGVTTYWCVVCSDTNVCHAGKPRKEMPLCLTLVEYDEAVAAARHTQEPK